jgi:hypothetical protein
LAQGEVAINITDKKVWVGNAATTPIQLLGDGGSVTFTSLTVTGVSTFSAGTVSAPSITTSGDTNTGMFFPAADTIAFTEGGVESMRINSSGNVGIGTSSPVTISNYTIATINNATTGSAVYLQQAGADKGRFIATASDVIVDTQAAIPLIFGTNSAEKMRITSDGNVLIGTTDVSGNAGIGVKMGITDGVEGFCQLVGSTSSNSSVTYRLYSTGAGAYRFYVGFGGTVFATNTTISAISDQRLKENIQDIDVGLDAVMSLKPRKFDWKDGKGKDIKGDRGWVAQEFEQVFPEMINEWKDPAPEGEEPYKSVAADLIPILVKAIQELNAKVEAQAAEIALLKSK